MGHFIAVAGGTLGDDSRDGDIIARNYRRGRPFDPARDEPQTPYERRIARGYERGFTRSQAAGHPRTGELSVSQALSAARSLGQSIWRFLTETSSERRARQEGAPEPVTEVPDVIQPLPPEELLPPEQRGFVVGPSFDDQFLYKAYQFGFVDEDGNVLDEEGLDLLRAGWFEFNDYTFDEVAYMRAEFFSMYDISWQDFDDWREYISEYVAA